MLRRSSESGGGGRPGLRPGGGHGGGGRGAEDGRTLRRGDRAGGPRGRLRFVAGPHPGDRGADRTFPQGDLRGDPSASGEMKPGRGAPSGARPAGPHRSPDHFLFALSGASRESVTLVTSPWKAALAFAKTGLARMLSRAARLSRSTWTTLW